MEKIPASRELRGNRRYQMSGLRLGRLTGDDFCVSAAPPGPQSGIQFPNGQTVQSSLPCSYGESTTTYQAKLAMSKADAWPNCCCTPLICRRCRDATYDDGHAGMASVLAVEPNARRQETSRSLGVDLAHHRTPRNIPKASVAIRECPACMLYNRMMSETGSLIYCRWTRSKTTTAVRQWRA